MLLEVFTAVHISYKSFGCCNMLERQTLFNVFEDLLPPSLGLSNEKAMIDIQLHYTYSVDHSYSVCGKGLSRV
jgi:hypothetical protein